ncbi:MAG: helix-turn-helix domain-containing protein, partial [Gaiellaceae bacterium]
MESRGVAKSLLLWVTDSDRIGGKQLTLTNGTPAARLGVTMQDQEQTLAHVTMAEVTKEARVRSRLSMRGLARRSGLSAAQISRIEAGEVERPV